MNAKLKKKLMTAIIIIIALMTILGLSGSLLVGL